MQTPPDPLFLSSAPGEGDENKKQEAGAQQEGLIMMSKLANDESGRGVVRFFFLLPLLPSLSMIMEGFLRTASP